MINLIGQWPAQAAMKAGTRTALTFQKRIKLLLTSIFTLVLTALLAAPVYAEANFCWKDTATRGVGTVPKACGPNQDRIGLLCYQKCPTNMKRAGFDCHSVCPDGMRDDGLFCRSAEYSRGAGYPWTIGDKPFSLDGAMARCNRENPYGCEKGGAIIYPKCKSGYSSMGLICRPKVPNCGALGLNAGIDLSCGKKITIGSPVTGVCGTGEHKDAGLCYQKCKAGFDGVGPVCWGQPPTKWDHCGMGAAIDSKTCASKTFSQIAAVGQLAITVASFGTTTPLTAGMAAPEKASRLAKLKQQYSALKVLLDNAKSSNSAFQALIIGKDAAMAGYQGYVAMNTAKDAVTEADMIRVAAQIAAIADPTGAASTVAAFSYPTCSSLGYAPSTGELME